MKRIAALMLTVAIAVCFSIQTGCTTKAEEFKASDEKVTLKQEGDKTVTFTGSTVAEATSSDTKAVTAEKTEKKDGVKLKALADAKPGDYTVTVKGENKKEVKLTVKVEEKK